MEDSSTQILLISLVGLIIWGVVLSQIIKGATTSHGHYLKMLFRLKAHDMRQKGYTPQQIKKVWENNEDEFWASLAEEPPKKLN